MGTWGTGHGVRRSAATVGRAAQLDRLVAAVATAAAGGGTCTVLVGEGGVGKSRLLAEAGAAARGRGLAVLPGCAPITSPVAYSVVGEALRSWLRDRPGAVPPSPYDRGLRLVLPEWPIGEHDTGSDLTAAQIRTLAWEGVVRVVRAVAARHGGAVLLLDDLHAADAESLETVRYLAAAGVAGIAVVCALRGGESAVADGLVRGLRGRGAEVLDLAVLDRAAVGALLAALLGAPAPEPLLADVAGRANGLPLYVEEVLDAHLRSGVLELAEDGPRWRGGVAVVPRTVRESVGARLAGIGRPLQDVVAAGAVLGRLEPDLLAAVAATDPAVVEDALAAGVAAGLLETAGGVLAFRHELVREAVLDGTLPHLVTLMHRRAAAALAAAGADAEVLERRAGHLAATGADEEAAALLAAAATARLAKHALLDAERLARAAAARATTGSAAPAAAGALAAALAAQGRWLEALDLDTPYAADPDVDPASGRARRLRMVGCALEAGRPELARDLLATAAAAGDSSPLLDLASGRVALLTGDAAAAVAGADAVLAGAGPGSGHRLAALELRGRALDWLGDRGGAIEAWSAQAAEAAAAGRTQDRLRAVVQLGKVELFAGQAPVRLLEAVEIAREAGALVELSWAQENLGIALLLRGDPAAGFAVLDEAVGRARELRLDQLAYLLAARACAGQILGIDGNADLSEAERISPTDDLRLHTAAVRATTAALEGRYPAAVDLFGECVRIMRSLPGAVPMDAPCWLPWALAAAGRPVEAAAALAEARALPDLARWFGRPVVVEAAAALLTGDAAGVGAVLGAAEESMPVDVALLRVLAAEVLGAPAAGDLLRQALAAFEAMGAAPAADRVRGLLRATGAPVPRRRAAAAGVPVELSRHGVTAREAEVLALLGEGLPNAEIAALLHLSVRTVETHVSALLAKLGARSRGQLTARSAVVRARGGQPGQLTGRACKG